MERLVLSVRNVALVSTNVAYRPTYKGKRAFYRRSSELLAFQADFSSKLEACRDSLEVFKEQVASESHLGLKLTLILEMPRDMFFYKRKTEELRPSDTSNYIKAIEDQISQFIGIDDKYNVRVCAVKCFAEGLDACNVYAILEPDDYMRYDSGRILEFYGLGTCTDIRSDTD